MNRMEQKGMAMRTKMRRIRQGMLAASALLAMAAGRCWAHVDGHHLIDGLNGTSFTLTAKSGYLSTADGNSLYFWG